MIKDTNDQPSEEVHRQSSAKGLEHRSLCPSGVRLSHTTFTNTETPPNIVILSFVLIKFYYKTTIYLIASCR